MQNYGNSTKIAIAKLVMMETGTYNPQYMRPYTTHLDNGTMRSLTHRLEETNNNRITGGLLAGLTMGMVRPQTEPGAMIQIPNGWGERRVRFFMEVHSESSLGTHHIHYIQGYTSFPGVTSAQHVAPDMEFIVNSIITVNRINQLTPNGLIPMDIIVDNVQVLSDRNWAGPVTSSGVYSMRPCDIYTGMHANYLQAGFGSPETGTITDLRLGMKQESIRSTRQNNLPSNYVANVLDKYIMSNDSTMFGQGQGDILTTALHNTSEASLYENPFIRIISDIRGMGSINNSFFWGDLQNIDPNVRNVTNIVGVGQTVLTGVHHTGQTEYWNGVNLETSAATVLSNAVPALMMELMLSKITFMSTNQDIGCTMNTRIVDAKSLTTGDITRNCEMFIMRFENEIMRDITYNNQIVYTLEMMVDMFGETRIRVSLDGKATMDFATPSFCDNLLTPIIAPNVNSFFGVVGDFDSFINYISDATKKSPEINFSQGI